MPVCTALKTKDSIACNKALPEGRTLCGLHDNVRLRVGEFKFAINQLNLKHKFEKNVERERVAPLLLQIEQLPVGPERRLMFEQYFLEAGDFARRQRREKQALRRQQQAHILANNGVNPDQEIINRRAVREVIRAWTGLYARILINHNFNWDPHVEAYRQRIRAMLHGGAIGNEAIERLNLHLDFINADYQVIVQQRGGQQHARVPRAVVPVQRANPNENMGAFAQDRQNVHTSAAVDQIKHNISIIRKIFVPPEYRWNQTTISKTYREIVFDCDLSPKGNWQFASYYCNNATIYDMEPGIFGIMTDGVWQYIRDSEDKRCLINILKREFEDNIGMCAQGNLSRVCNILSGYLPGIGQSDSVSTILGREFPKLMAIENETDRVFQGTEILRNNNVPDAEWEAWLEPLRA